MGVDIYLKSEKKEFSCRLYWITNLINEYDWQYKQEVPNLISGSNLNEKEIKQLFVFLEFSLLMLKKDKKRILNKFDSAYFKKAEEIHQTLKLLIDSLNKKRQIDKKLLPKLQGLLRRLEGFNDAYEHDPGEQKKEISEDFDEKIFLVKKINTFLKNVIEKKGSVSIA